MMTTTTITHICVKCMLYQILVGACYVGDAIFRRCLQTIESEWESFFSRASSHSFWKQVILEGSCVCKHALIILGDVSCMMFVIFVISYMRIVSGFQLPSSSPSTDRCSTWNTRISNLQEYFLCRWVQQCTAAKPFLRMQLQIWSEIFSGMTSFVLNGILCLLL